MLRHDVVNSGKNLICLGMPLHECKSDVELTCFCFRNSTQIEAACMNVDGFQYITLPQLRLIDERIGQFDGQSPVYATDQKRRHDMAPEFRHTKSVQLN